MTGDIIVLIPIVVFLLFNPTTVYWTLNKVEEYKQKDRL
jgi:hypothetical protein